MRTNTEPEEVMTVTQVAEWLQQSEQTIRALMRKGKLPGRKVGAEWRVLRSELEAWLRQSEPSAAEEEK